MPFGHQKQISIFKQWARLQGREQDVKISPNKYTLYSGEKVAEGNGLISDALWLSDGLNKPRLSIRNLLAKAMPSKQVIS